MCAFFAPTPVADHRTQPARRDSSLCCWVFFLFVPSLAWQNDRSNLHSGGKTTPLSVCLSVLPWPSIAFGFAMNNAQPSIFVHASQHSAIVFASPLRFVELPTPSATLRKTASFLSHLYIKPIILPRQARDKHREGTLQKRCRFSHQSCKTKHEASSSQRYLLLCLLVPSLS